MVMTGAASASVNRACYDWHIICYRTFRKNCEASISPASEDGTALSQFNDQHNHKKSQVGQNIYIQARS